MRYDRLTTAEQQATVLQGLKNLEAQALQVEMDIEVNRASGDTATVEMLEQRLQALTTGIGAVRAKWRTLLAFKPVETNPPKGK